MSETKRFDPYTGDPIPDEVADTVGQPLEEQTTSQPFEGQAAGQPYPSAYSTPPQNETQYNPYTGQPIIQNSEDAEEKDRKANIYGTVALIAGIASIVFSFCSLCCCPFLTLIAGVLGIIFGCLAKNSTGTRTGTGTAGLITSIIGLVLCLLITIFAIVASGDDFMEGFQKGFENGWNGFYEDDNGNTYDYDFNSLYDSDDFYAK